MSVAIPVPSYRAEIPAIEKMTLGDKWRVIRRIFGHAGPYKGFIAISVALTLILTLLGLIDPFITQYLVDHVLVQKEARLLDIVFGVMIGIFVARLFYGLLSGYLGFYMVNRVNFDIRKRFFRHLEALPIRFYEKNPLAEIVQTEAVSLPQMQGFLLSSLGHIFQNVLTLLIALAVLLLMHPKLALFSLAFIPVWAAGIVFFTRRLAPIGQRLDRQAVTLRSRFFEFVHGIDVVKACGREAHERKRYFGELSERASIQVEGMTWQVLSDVILGSVTFFNTAFVLWYGGHAILRGELSIGQLVAFNMFLGRLFGPVSALLGYYRSLNDICIAALRVFTTWDMVPDIRDAKDALALPRVEGNVELREVSFRYEEGGPLAVKNVSFEVAPGEMVAFCGPSGSGKSTIAKLLLRLYDPTEGQVFVDGFDVREIRLEDLRRATAIVSQRPFLFQDTLEANIRYGRLDATREEVEQAARAAEAHDFIAALPKGYETRIEAHMAGLSGGQVQRISIARTLLRDPRILVLDEATSALDPETEALIQESLEHLMRGRTSVVIAHRLSTIQNASRIYVLDKGEIVEVGTHEELLARRGLYFGLYRQQARRAAEEAAVTAGATPVLA